MDRALIPSPEAVRAAQAVLMAGGTVEDMLIVATPYIAEQVAAALIGAAVERIRERQLRQETPDGGESDGTSQVRDVR